MRIKLRIFSFCTITVLFVLSDVVLNIAAAEQTREELEQWFNNDTIDEEEKALSVNEGELEFLLKPPSKPIHHSQNRLTITEDSIKTGWIGLRQCHTHLDVVFAAQILYRYKRFRNLKIASTYNIEKAWVEGKSVQMENISGNASICVEADVALLSHDNEGNVILTNSPFHRKFLDGYYPMHVSLDILYPHDRLAFLSIHPTKQTGFNITQEKGRVRADAWFEGVLGTQVRFQVLVKRNKY